MQAIKAVVIFMGILIIGGLGLLGWGVMTKLDKQETPPEAKAEAPAAPVASMHASAPALEVAGFGALTLDQPPGTAITGTSLSGHLLAVTVDGGGQGPRVVVVDLSDGAVLGSIGTREPAR